MPADFLGFSVVRLTIHTSMGGQAGIITRHYSALTAASNTFWRSTDLFNELISNSFPGAIKDCISDDANYDGMKLYCRPVPGTPPDIDTNRSNAGVGSGGAGRLPAQIAGLLRWTSNLGGPRGRGRDYIPFPWTAASEVTGLPSAAYKSNIDSLAAILNGPYILPNVGTGGGSVTVRPCTLYQVGGVSGIAYPMTAYEVGNGFATQRRRGFYGQVNNPF